MNLTDIEQGPNDLRSVVVSAAGVVCIECFCHFLSCHHSLECGQGRQVREYERAEAGFEVTVSRSGRWHLMDWDGMRRSPMCLDDAGFATRISRAVHGVYQRGHNTYLSTSSTSIEG
jgi:hypothetical protein